MDEMDSTAKAARILLLGDPALREIAGVVESFDEPSFVTAHQRLYVTLLDFRNHNGFGRAISAPQIGLGRRIIAMCLRGERHIIVNPQITWRSSQTFTMWDDCMSYPSLLARLERVSSISIHFQDERGTHQDWEHLDIATAELLQHEIDHLDGVLAIDRAIDRESIILRETYSAMPEYFRRLVDYEIAAEVFS